MLGERALPHPAAFIEPCLLRSAKQPPEGRGWIHEIKHDGNSQLFFGLIISKIKALLRGWKLGWRDRYDKGTAPPSRDNGTNVGGGVRATSGSRRDFMVSLLRSRSCVVSSLGAHVRRGSFSL